MLSLLYHPALTSVCDYGNIALTFVGTVMSLLCNMLSRFVIAFFPRSKYLEEDDDVIMVLTSLHPSASGSPPGGSQDTGQEGLVCCSPWGHKELDMTE